MSDDEKMPGEFTWEALREALREEFPLQEVEDTGGGCVVARVRKSADDVPVQLGPGWWDHVPGALKFWVRDFSIAAEDEMGPTFRPADLAGPADLAEILALTKTAYGLYNNGREHWEFTAEDILSRLREEFPAAYCNQTGGGTATLYIHKVPGDIAVTVGPGSFNWREPDKSVFYCGEFSAGMEPYKNDGMEERDEDELGPDVPFNELSAPIPAEFDRVAKLIAEYHAIYNNGDYPSA